MNMLIIYTSILLVSFFLGKIQNSHLTENIICFGLKNNFSRYPGKDKAVMSSFLSAITRNNFSFVLKKTFFFISYVH
jgi:hypothetical protein